MILLVALHLLAASAATADEENLPRDTRSPDTRPAGLTPPPETHASTSTPPLETHASEPTLSPGTHASEPTSSPETHASAPTSSPETHASAPASSPDTHAPAPTSWSWYGWQPLLCDAATLLFIGQAANAGTDLGSRWSWSGAAGATFVLGPQVIHWLHDRTNVILTSLLVRALIPGVIGGSLYLLVGRQEYGFGNLTGATPYFFGGLAAIVGLLIDDIGLSRAPISPSPSQPASASLRWAPFVGMVRDIRMAGLAGTF